MREFSKNRGIILHSLKFGESGLILYMYTENHGRQSYFLRTSNNGKVRIGANQIVMQPFSALDIVEYSTNDGANLRIKEAKRSFLTASTVFDIRKSTISMFVSEFLYKVVRECSPNPMMFDYMFHSIKLLDSLEEGVSNFHIYFLVNLCSYMGFSPNNNYQPDNFFDITLGRYTTIRPQHDKYFTQEISQIFHDFQSCSVEDLKNIKLNRNQRVDMLYSIIHYYEYHHETTYKIASLKILSEIF